MNDYEARLDRLKNAKKGDTVTIPEGWTSPKESPRSVVALRPGDILTHDGKPDGMPWRSAQEVADRDYTLNWYRSARLAAAGLDVDVATDPNTDGVAEKITEVEREAAAAAEEIGFGLDEFQQERVAALEHALRILESRRAPEPSGKQTFGDLFTTSGTPRVSAQDMIDVAAFIADGDTGRIDEVPA